MTRVYLHEEPLPLSKLVNVIKSAKSCSCYQIRERCRDVLPEYMMDKRVAISLRV